MQKGRSGIGSRKHGKSGKVHNHQHFTGKKAGKKTKRKGSTRKQRRQDRGQHRNKYKDE